MSIKPLQADTLQHKFSYEVNFIQKNKDKTIVGQMFATGAEQVILALLEQYPDCKGTVKRIKP